MEEFGTSRVPSSVVVVNVFKGAKSSATSVFQHGRKPYSSITCTVSSTLFSVSIFPLKYLQLHLLSETCVLTLMVKHCKALKETLACI